MAAGWQVGAICLENLDLAAASSCASAYGVTSSGLLSCSGYSLGSSAYTLTLSDGSTPTIYPMACEYPTFADTWSPIFGAILVATCVIWGMRKLINIFQTGGENV